MYIQNARTDVSNHLFYFFLIRIRAYASSRATCTHKTHAQMCVCTSFSSFFYTHLFLVFFFCVRHAHTIRTHRCVYAPLSRLLFHQYRALWSDQGSSHTAPAAIRTLGSRELEHATALTKPQLWSDQGSSHSAPAAILKYNCLILLHAICVLIILLYTIRVLLVLHACKLNVLILLHACPHTTICVSCVSSYYYMRVRMLLYTCPHATICVSSSYYACHACPRTTICVSACFYIIYVSSSYYIDVSQGRSARLPHLPLAYCTCRHPHVRVSRTKARHCSN